MMMSTIWNIFLLTTAILLMEFHSGDIHLDLLLLYAEEDVVFIAFLVLSQEVPAPAGGLQVQGAEQVVAALQHVHHGQEGGDGPAPAEEQAEVRSCGNVNLGS